MDDRIARAIIGALREVDRSGHELWHWLGPVHGANEELTEANLYPTLHRLEAERLIRGEYRDREPTRRVYRIAARGRELANRRGWPALAHRTEPDPLLTKPAGDEEGHGAAEPEPGAPSCDDYLARLDAALRLCGTQRRSVRHEIEDHLADCSAELVKAGLDESDATREAIARLGPPEVLAESINRSQLTPRRLLEGIPPALYVAVFAGGLGTAAGASLLFLAPLLARLLTSIAQIAGVHLYFPETGEWRDQQLLAALWLGAFMAGRISLPRLANETRRLESGISRWWSLGLGLPLLFVVLLLPILLDPTTVVGLLGVPVAFAAGSWRYKKVGDDPASRKGIVAAAVLLVPFVFTPGVRAWIYDPAAHGGSIPSPAISSGVSVAWDHSSGYWEASVVGVDEALWHDVQIEFWPVLRQGPFIVPDPSASEPLLIASPAGTRLPALEDPPSDLWVAVTAVGGDGQRRTLHAEVHQTDRSGGPNLLLGWLLGNR
jgi:DNA-binding PadR family transcriptional regulator